MKVYADGKSLTKESVNLISITDDGHESLVRIDEGLIVIENIDVKGLNQTIRDGKMTFVIKTKVE